MFLPLEQTADDARRAMDKATALDLREIDYFRLAYRRWYGRDIRSRQLERAFAEYMFHREVPIWVRHFSRQVSEGEASGALDPLAFGAGRYKRQPPPPPRYGKVTVALTIGAFVLYSFVLMDTSYHPQTSAPMYCQGGGGLKFFADMAHAISGKERPPCDRLDSAQQKAEKITKTDP